MQRNIITFSISLLQERTTLQTEVNKLLHDNKRLMKKNTELKENSDAAADVMREKEKLNSRLEELVKVNSRQLINLLI